MKREIYHEVLGKITYEESFFTGRKTIFVNGYFLEPVNKNTFRRFINNEYEIFNVTGNYITGVTLLYGSKLVEIVPKTLWYEYIIYFLPLIINLIWGNSIYLCKIIPVVGGLIGGAITGFFSALSLVFGKNAKNLSFKLLTICAFVLISFVICALIGYAIVSSL